MNTEEYKALTDYRQDLLSTKQKTQDNLDKYIITLSGGAIGVTTSFFKEAVGKEGIFLLLAWIFWVISILIALWSMSTSGDAHEKTVSIIDKGIRRKDDLLSIYDYIEKGVTNTLDKKTKILNSIAKIFFLLGFIFVAIFTYSFISDKQAYTMADNDKRRITQDGQTVRPVPPIPNSNIIKKGQTVSPPPPPPPQTPPAGQPPAKQ